MRADFTVGHDYTRDEIRAAVGGSKRICLPTRDGVVLAACLVQALNPRAPREILCGVGPRNGPAGALLAGQRRAIPVFVKAAVNRWRYAGPFEVADSFASGSRYERAVARSSRPASDVSRVVVLRPSRTRVLDRHA